MQPELDDLMLYKFLDRVYPVGSIYENDRDDRNPADILGFGQWSVFGAGRVLVAINASDTEFDTIGETGGAKTVTLTTAQIPAHTHGLRSLIGRIVNYAVQSSGTGVSDGGIVETQENTGSVGYATSSKSGSGGYSDEVEIDASHEHDSVGGDDSHNNLQPYIVVYRWVRTA